MDSLEDIIKVVGGLIFGAIYLFGNQIFKSREEDSGAPTSPRQSNEDDDAARQRQIQEAIRRKIMERRQAASGGSPPPIMASRELQQETVERPAVHQRSPQGEVPSVAANDSEQFSWDKSDNVYEQQMQERLKQIEATKRRADALKRQAKAAGSAGATVASQRAHSSLGRRGLTGSVRDSLRNPAAARTAFIYSEVMGKPVGMREPGSGVAN